MTQPDVIHAEVERQLRMLKKKIFETICPSLSSTLFTNLLPNLGGKLYELENNEFQKGITTFFKRIPSLTELIKMSSHILFSFLKVAAINKILF